MDEAEVKDQLVRVARYRELEKARNEICAAIEAVTKADPAGPCGQGPFTGNTRESRQVQAIRIYLTASRGGAPPVEVNIHNMHIEACEFGRLLENMLRAKLPPITNEIEKL